MSPFFFFFLNWVQLKERFSYDCIIHFFHKRYGFYIRKRQLMKTILYQTFIFVYFFLFQQASIFNIFYVSYQNKKKKKKESDLLHRRQRNHYKIAYLKCGAPITLAQENLMIIFAFLLLAQTGLSLEYCKIITGLLTGVRT